LDPRTSVGEACQYLEQHLQEFRNSYTAFFTFLVEIKTMALADSDLAVSNMLNKLHGQPESYDKK